MAAKPTEAHLRGHLADQPLFGQICEGFMPVAH